MVLQNGFSYSLFSTKFKYETYFLKIKTKDYNTLKIFIFLILDRVKKFRELNGAIKILLVGRKFSVFSIQTFRK